MILELNKENIIKLNNNLIYSIFKYVLINFPFCLSCKP